MALFGFIGVFLMPVLGYLFILNLLRAIKRIVKDEEYMNELVWSGSIFGLIVWTITMIAIMASK